MPVSKRLRYEVLRRDNHACRYCGRSAPDVKLTIDHVVPTALGGSDEPSNLVTACSDCNSGKTSTNPDAPLVENVASDALRWAQAQQLAAQQMLADMSRRRDACRRFKTGWDQWNVNGRPIALPDGWENSIDNFLAAGLPMEVLLDCITKAMSSQRVKAADTFRYMCGVAWSRVRDLQKAAKVIAAGRQEEPSNQPENPYRSAIYTLLIDGIDDPSLFPYWAELFDERYEDDEVDYSDWPEELKALTWYLLQRIEEGWNANYMIKNFLDRMPNGKFYRLRAAEEAREAGPDCPSAPADIDRFALALALRELCPEVVVEDVWS